MKYQLCCNLEFQYRTDVRGIVAEGMAMNEEGQANQFE